MNLTQRRVSCVVAALCTLGLFAGESFAQADFQEGFDNNGPTQAGDHGPINLINQGWIFRNQSEPIGPWHWLDELLGDPPQAGASNLAASLWNVDGAGIISNWAILPEVPNQTAGDLLSFWVLNAGNNPDGYQIRYSPSGSTGTGTGAEDVGDFAVLLFERFMLPPSLDWAEVVVEVPGPGRLAIRHYVNPGGIMTPNGGYLRIDTLSVAPLPEPPAIEIVNWSAADNPHLISGGLVVIPENQHVIAEPGVEIVVDSDGSMLHIAGQLTVHGTELNPITITGEWSQISPPIRVSGTIDLQFVNVTGLIQGGSGCTILAADSNFPQGMIQTRQRFTSHQPKYVQIDRCSFTAGGNVFVIDGTLAIRDTSFEPAAGGPVWLDGSLHLLRSYLFVDNVTIDGGYLEHSRQRSPQTAYINNVTVLNCTDHAAIDLRASNFFLGPDNVLQNNLYPVQLTAGLDPGSTLPASGNINNYIWNAADGGFSGTAGRATWPDLGIPYVVDGLNTSGEITFLPGATVQFPQNSGMNVAGTGRVRTLGLPDNPVVFQAFSPGVQWLGFAVVASKMTHKLEYIVVEGASTGVIASGTLLNIENSILRNNGIGNQSNSGGLTRIRKTRIFNNGVGAQGSSGQGGFSGRPDLFSQTNPNWIEGNGIGVQALDISSNVDARFNYWGDPSGPTTPSNPGGTGDPVEGPGAVTYSPFLSTLPDFNDHPPIVRLTDPAGYAETGETKMINWDVIEDGVVASQRVLFTPAFGHPWQVLADNLPGGQRALEFTVPFGNPGGGPSGPAWIKVEAVDNTGQIGWDETFFSVPNEAVTPDSDYFLTTPITGTLTMGEQREICWGFTGEPGNVSVNLALDADHQNVPLGGSTTLCAGTFNAPYVSTDTARIQIVVGYSTLGNRVFYSDYFSIRPDPRLGDEPPTVQMLTPTAGQSFAGGTVVPVTWSASDDEAVRSFDIQVSYDGGRGWQYVARDLPPEATSFDWLTPPSAGVPDVRVRVIVRDLRFQNSSDGGDQVISITASVPLPPGDINGDGLVDMNDVPDFTAALLGVPNDPAHTQRADLNGDGTPNGLDTQSFIAALIP